MRKSIAKVLISRVLWVPFANLSYARIHKKTENIKRYELTQATLFAIDTCDLTGKIKILNNSTCMCIKKEDCFTIKAKLKKKIYSTMKTYE